MNSGENFRFAASVAVRSTLLSSLSSPLSAGCTNPMPPVITSVIPPPPRSEVRKIIVADRSTRRLSPSVSVALSKIPSSNCHSASEAFSISSNSRKLSFSFLGVILRQSLLRDQRVRLPVPQVPRRRANQLGNLVRVLKLGAIHPDHRPWVPEQYLRRGFHNARLS